MVEADVPAAHGHGSLWESDLESALERTLGKVNFSLDEAGAPLVLVAGDEVGQPMNFSSDIEALVCCDRLRELVNEQSAAKLLTIEVAPPTVETPMWRVVLRPGPACGFCGLLLRGQLRVLEVTPKLPETAFLRLLELALGVRVTVLHDPPRPASLDSRGLVELLAAAYAAALAALLRRGLRRRHERREMNLRGALKGRLLVERYARQVGRLGPDVFPCRFETQELDNPTNRALYAALVTVRTALVLQGRPRNSASDIVEVLTSLEAAFAGVGSTPPPVAALDRERLPPGFAHYRDSGALRLATWILRGLGDRGDGATSFGVTFTMHKVFEDAFARCAARFADRGGLGQSQQWADHFGVQGGLRATKGFQTDVIIQDNKAGLVIDTKWKNAVTEDDECALLPTDSLTGVSFKHADVYQVIAYARLLERRHGGKPFQAALVYPARNMVAPIDGAGLESGTPDFLVAGWNVATADPETTARDILERLWSATVRAGAG